MNHSRDSFRSRSRIPFHSNCVHGNKAKAKAISSSSSCIILFRIPSTPVYSLILSFSNNIQHHTDIDRQTYIHQQERKDGKNSNSCNTNNNIICSLPRIKHHGNRCRTNQHRPMFVMMAIETTTPDNTIRGEMT